MARKGKDKSLNLSMLGLDGPMFHNWMIHPYIMFIEIPNKRDFNKLIDYIV